jgi:predicted transcriptional regulator
MKDKIRNLADEGFSSDEVADRLGLSLAVVNKYW